ncbi:MAG TPA: type III pantothenate kinase [Steroidobacteraceae bacterium]|nr:type III pantothenate kinase [Steroidobacteraceae bacterium]
MKLLLDIGNTRIKSAVWHDGALSQHNAVAHAGCSAAQLQSQLLQCYGPVSSVWISNVAGAEIAGRIRQAVQQRWQLEPTFVTAAAMRGEVRNAYPQPEKLGVDRWMSLLAAHAMHTGAQVNLIVSVGTAMTLDALGADGQHRGGLIVPGPDLMINSLLHNTSDIAAHSADGIANDTFFADNTLGAIQQGAARACAALIESAYRHLAIEESLKVLITGGAASRVMPLLGVPAVEVPDLVLQGLAVMARE